MSVAFREVSGAHVQRQAPRLRRLSYQGDGALLLRIQEEAGRTRCARSAACSAGHLFYILSSYPAETHQLSFRDADGERPTNLGINRQHLS